MNERSLVTAFRPGASSVWHSRLSNPVEPAVTRPVPAAQRDARPICGAMQCSRLRDRSSTAASATRIASIARGEGPKGFSLESSLISCGLVLREDPRGGARRIAAHLAGRLRDQIKKSAHARGTSCDADCFAPATPVLLADFNRSISFNVSDRNLPGGTSSVSGP